jgi:type II secretory pathway pseudopilin PulG
MIYSDKIKSFKFNDPCLCNSWVAAAVIGAGALGAGASIYGSKKAAETQSNAAQQAAAIQQQQYQQTRQDLAPYRAIGEEAYAQLKPRLVDLTSPISIDPDVLQNSDYYKFASKEGQRAVTNAAAARGLGKAGAALKGAASFAKGLATDTYKTAFDMENINRTNAYNRLKALIDTGAGAATGTGVLGEKAAYNTGTALVGGANAEAAGYNRIGSSVANLAGNIGGYAMYNGLYGSGGGNVLPGGPSGHVPFTA